MSVRAATGWPPSLKPAKQLIDGADPTAGVPSDAVVHPGNSPLTLSDASTPIIGRPVAALHAVLLAAGLLLLPGCRAVGMSRAASVVPAADAASAADSEAGFAVVELGPIIPISDEEGFEAPAPFVSHTFAEPALPEPLTSCDDAASCPCEFSVRGDLHRYLPRLRDDAVGLVNWNNAALFGTALGGALVVRSELDDQVRDNTERHPERWGGTSNSLGHLGDPTVQIPVLIGFYAYSVHAQDDELHDLMGTLISAYTLNGAATLLVKGIANTDRPSDEWNGGQFGFPSYHTSSSFAMAAVLDEYEGPCVGVPAYLLAGLIGWSRIDERDHDLSDVIFGAAMGYLIGKSVARNHLEGDSRVRLLPYAHPTEGSSGLMLDVAF